MNKSKVTPEGIACMSKFFWNEDCTEPTAQAISDVINYGFDVNATADKFGVNSTELSSYIERYQSIIELLPTILDLLNNKLKDQTKSAIIERLLTGKAISHCAQNAGTEQGNLSRSLKSMQQAHHKIQETAALYRKLELI